MVVKVYISGISGNKEVKKRQQRVLMILDSKNIKYEVIDIAEPGREPDKEFMQVNSKSSGATMSDPEPRHPLPPQIFNDSEYCGDYDHFDLANEMDTLEQLVKIEAPAPEPRVDKVEENNVNGDIHSEETLEKKGGEIQISTSKEGLEEKGAEMKSSTKEVNDEKIDSKQDKFEKNDTSDNENTNLNEMTVAKEENPEREGSPVKDGAPAREETLVKEGIPVDKTSTEKGEPEKNKTSTRDETPEEEGTPEKEASSRVEQDLLLQESVKNEAPENQSIPEKHQTPEKELHSESENIVSSREPSVEKRVTLLEGTKEDPEGRKNADLSEVLIESEIVGASQ